MRRFLALLALGAAICAVPASAAPPKRAMPPAGQAKHALDKVKELQKGQGVRTGFELSPALNQLYAALPSLSASDRQTAEAILARPNDNQTDPADTHKWSGTEAGGSPKCTVHFCVHYTTNSGPDDSSGAYATQMANLFETQVYPCENGTAPTACGGSPGLGWRDAAPDGTPNGDNRVDIYVEDLYTNERVFGYVAVDPGQPQDPSVPHSAYLVMDKDYTRFGDVRELLSAVDDRYVIMNAGDEVRLSFPAPAAAEPGAPKWPQDAGPRRRDFILIGDGWVKDGDYNTTASKTVGPLPRHGHPDYAALASDDIERDPVYRAHAADWQQYHTRFVDPRSFLNGLR
jgi:hypothetical protein